MQAKSNRRLSHLLIALATGTLCATAFAQNTLAPAPADAGAPPGTLQIQAPKDPLVQRREDRKAANVKYKADKKAAKSEYKQDVGAASQERKSEKKAADEAARDAMAPKQ
jgi:hypothetical protein